MVDNTILKTKIKKQLKELKLKPAEEDLVVKELNYLSNLLIDIYISKSKGGEKQKRV